MARAARSAAVESPTPFRTLEQIGRAASGSPTGGNPRNPQSGKLRQAGLQEQYASEAARKKLHAAACIGFVRAADAFQLLSQPNEAARCMGRLRKTLVDWYGELGAP